MKLTLKIPENLNEITLGQYQEFLRLENPNEEDVVKTFLNLSTVEVERMLSSDVERFAAQIVSLFSQEPKHQLKFDLNGLSFGFIPNIDQITYGENKDVTAYINDWQQMHKAAAVLYRPVLRRLGSKYEIEEYQGSHKYSETMKEAPLGAVMGMLVFFYTLTNDLLQAIPNYLETQTKKERVAPEVSQKLGDLTKKFTPLLKETSEDLKKLLNYQFTLA
jgi:hypothetical protein